MFPAIVTETELPRWAWIRRITVVPRTISVGVVSGYRSLEGSDYMQFSAPISPGNSGGPVVDEQGRVLAVASAKLVGNGVEALSLGIPVQVACGALVTCSVS